MAARLQGELMSAQSEQSLHVNRTEEPGEQRFWEQQRLTANGTAFFRMGRYIISGPWRHPLDACTLVAYLIETKEPDHLAAAFRSRRWHFGLESTAGEQLMLTRLQQSSAWCSSNFVRL